MKLHPKNGEMKKQFSEDKDVKKFLNSPIFMAQSHSVVIGFLGVPRIIPCPDRLCKTTFVADKRYLSLEDGKSEVNEAYYQGLNDLELEVMVRIPRTFRQKSAQLL